MEQNPLVNWLTTMAVAKTEASAVVDKLVTTTRGRQTGTDNNQCRQWQACHGVGGAAAAQRPQGIIVGQEVDIGHAAVLVGQRRGIISGEGLRRRRVCRCIVGVATALLEHEGSGECGPIRNGSDNQHVVRWCVWLDAWWGGDGIHHSRHWKQRPLHQQKRRGRVLCKDEGCCAVARRRLQ